MDTKFFHHDNTTAHRSKACTDYLVTTRLKLLKVPLYSLDLAHSDFVLVM